MSIHVVVLDVRCLSRVFNSNVQVPDEFCPFYGLPATGPSACVASPQALVLESVGSDSHGLVRAADQRADQTAADSAHRSTRCDETVL
eukprot:6204504-Pleurochrysis_carterae.AAC.1